MDDVVDRSAELVPAILDRELDLIRTAIAMVASTGAPRVIVAGLRFGDHLLDPGRRLALDYGVRLVPLWRADEAGTDLAIERIAE